MTTVNFNISGYTAYVSFKELTGTMSATNMGGWGGSNEAISDATSAKLFVGVPGNTDLIELDLYPDYPTTGSTELQINASSLGLAKIYAGVYKFIYQVKTADNTYEKTIYFWFDSFIK